MRNSMIPKIAGLVFAAILMTSTVASRADDADDYMGAYGHGYGMMGGYGMGPGMMNGSYGMMGSGMMGGYGGYGHGYMGMMGTGMPGMLNLTDEQRTKMEKIRIEERKQHLVVMGKMLDMQSKMRELYAADEPDPKKVGAVYGEMAKLQQQMLETHVQASNQMRALLTKEQREQFKQWHRGGGGSRGSMGNGRGMPGPGNMPGGMMGR